MSRESSGEEGRAIGVSVPPDRAELRARILSSIIMAPAALLAAWIGGPLFAGMIAAGGVILAREWTRMSDPGGEDIAFALAAGGAAGATIAASARLEAWAAGIAAVLAIAAGLEALRRGKAREAAFGTAYISTACASLVWLRLQGEGEGERLVTYLFACVWGADIGAYAAGKLVGGPRLLPAVSPNKTWAGLGGGLVLAVVFGLLAVVVTDWRAPSTSVALAAAALGAAGLSGDLFESWLKRRFGVKDTGTLIPGHGGLFDRVDGLMAAVLVMVVWAVMEGVR